MEQEYRLEQKLAVVTRMALYAEPTERNLLLIEEAHVQVIEEHLKEEALTIDQVLAAVGNNLLGTFSQNSITRIVAAVNKAADKRVQYETAMAAAQADCRPEVVSQEELDYINALLAQAGNEDALDRVNAELDKEQFDDVVKRLVADMGSDRVDEIVVDLGYAVGAVDLLEAKAFIDLCDEVGEYSGRAVDAMFVLNRKLSETVRAAAIEVIFGVHGLPLEGKLYEQTLSTPHCVENVMGQYHVVPSYGNRTGFNPNLRKQIEDALEELPDVWLDFVNALVEDVVYE